MEFLIEYITVEHCPLCNDPLSQTFDRRVFKGFPVENRICLRCGLVYQSPRMTDQALEEFYQAEYRQVYQEEQGPTPKDIYVQEKRALALSKFLQQKLSTPINPANFLDIGCSTGSLLERLDQDFNLVGFGVEPGIAYRNYASRRGLKVVPSLDDLHNHAMDRFGLISLIHVLEHLSQPVLYLKRLCQEYLSPTGYLLVEVPNLYAHDCFEVAHLVSFSAHTLKETLKQAGYQLLALHSHGAPRSKLLPLYLTALAIPEPKPHEAGIVRPEKGVKYKRWAGMLRRRILERLAIRQAWLPLPDL